MNKSINNKTEIRLKKKKDGDGKTNKKKETGTREDISLIKINSTCYSNNITYSREVFLFQKHL